MKRALVTASILLFCAPAHAADGSIQRLVQELQQCHNMDNPACRSLTVRLSNYGRRVVRPVQRAFPKLSPAGQVIALTAMANIQDASATRFLIVLSKRSSIVVRGLALGALADRFGTRVETAIVAALRAKEATLRGTAAHALGKSQAQRKRKRIVPPLVKVAEGDESVAVRLAAIESLGMLGAPEGVPAMRAALGHRNLRLRKAALFALRFVEGAQSAVPDVIELLRVEDRLMAQDAGKTLEKMTGNHFGVDYELWKGWWAAQQD